MWPYWQVKITHHSGYSIYIIYRQLFLFEFRSNRAGNKGFAYTFITKEQERFSGDIVRALELSGIPVPPELDTMWVRYRAKQAAVCV